MQQMNENSPKTHFVVIKSDGSPFNVWAHRVDFAGEMNSCLLFQNHTSEYEVEFVYAFSNNAWKECYPLAD